MEKILLFIPVYNCENQIVKTLEQVKNEFVRHISEIIVVDNGSADRTRDNVKQYLENNRDFPASLFQNNENYNLGGSHKTAFQYAIDNGFDYVIVLHGDNQGDIRDIIPVVKDNIHHNYDCCLGARFKKGSKLIGYSKFRTFGNIVFNILFSIALRRKIYDLGAGLNIYNVNMLKSKFYMKFPDSLSFNYCMVMALDYYKQSAMFFPLSWKEEDQISNVKLTSQTLNLLKMLLLYAFDKQSFINSDMRTKAIEDYGFVKIY